MDRIIVSIFDEQLRVFNETGKLIFELNLNCEKTCGQHLNFVKRYYKIFNLPDRQDCWENFLIQTKTYGEYDDQGDYVVDFFLFRLLSLSSTVTIDYKLTKLPPITFPSSPVVKISQFHPSNIGHFICRDIRQSSSPATFLLTMTFSRKIGKKMDGKKEEVWKTTLIPIEFSKDLRMTNVSENFKSYKYFPFSKKYSLDQIIFTNTTGTTGNIFRGNISLKNIPSLIDDYCYFDDQHVVSYRGKLINIGTLESRNLSIYGEESYSATESSQNSGVTYLNNIEGELFRISSVSSATSVSTASVSTVPVGEGDEKSKMVKTITEQICKDLKVQAVIWAKDDLIILCVAKYKNDKNIGEPKFEIVLVNLENDCRQTLHSPESLIFRESRVVVNSSKYESNLRNFIDEKFAQLFPTVLWEIIFDYAF
jgi:hypothetical protein